MSSQARVSVLVCEDEPLARGALREYLSDVEWIEIVGEAEHGQAALRLIQKLEPDVVFLDVRMPGLSGLEVLDAMTHQPAVVFTTAYDEYAVRAFDLGAVDYLVKPFGKLRLLETLQRVRVRLVGEGLSDGHSSDAGSPRGGFPRRLFARRKSGIVPIAPEGVIAADATPTGVVLRCADTSYDMDGTLGELERRLDPTDFVRVHRSHIVNLNHVNSIRRYDERRLEIRLSNGASVIASRQGSKALKDSMES